MKIQKVAIYNIMALFTHKAFLKDDDYMTPKSAWEDIKHLIPKDKVIWEAFYGDAKSGNYLKELGFNVIHEPIDFFQNDVGDIVVSNPPFSKIPDVLKRLKELNKPFILIMPVSKINTQYTQKLFSGDKELQLLIPPKRINFNKQDSNNKSNCNFDCFYYCWKMKFNKDLIWLNAVK